MKTKFIHFLLVAILLSFASCASYYQIYQVVPLTDVKETPEYLIYEGDNFEIKYNMWSEGGNSGFLFYNHSNSNIYLNLEESFFIFNGEALNYYKNRKFSSLKTEGLSASGLSSSNVLQKKGSFLSVGSAATGVVSASLLSNSGVTYEEEKIICIPPKSYKKVFEYNINNQLIKDCDLKERPQAKRASYLEFDKESSPFVFKNYISYKKGENGKQQVVENEFYVSSISNHNGNAITEVRNLEDCGKNTLEVSFVFKSSPPSQFYLKY